MNWDAPWAQAAALLGRPDSLDKKAETGRFRSLEEAAAVLFPGKSFSLGPGSSHHLPAQLEQAVDDQITAEVGRVLGSLKPLPPLVAWPAGPLTRTKNLAPRSSSPWKTSAAGFLKNELLPLRTYVQLAQDRGSPLASIAVRDYRFTCTQFILRLRFSFAWKRDQVLAAAPGLPGWKAIAEEVFRPSGTAAVWADFSRRSEAWLDRRYTALFHRFPLSEEALAGFCRIKAREKRRLFRLIETLAGFQDAPEIPGGTP